MSSDETLQKNHVTTEADPSETASSPEVEAATPAADSSPPPPEEPAAPSAMSGEPVAEPTSPQPEMAREETSGSQNGTAAETPAEPTPAEQPPPPAETPAPAEPMAETPTPESAPAEPQPAESRPRPQLNPTVNPAEAKAIPSLEVAESATLAETASPGTPSFEHATPVPVLPPSKPPSKPAEIPRTAPLDADLEAEIAAAQAGDESQPQPALPATGETESPEKSETESTPPAVPTTEEDLEPGYRLQGKVQSISGDDVFFDVGFRSPALVSLRQFDPAKPPEVGQSFQVVVDKVNAEEGLIHGNLPRGRRKIQGNWDAITVGQVVDCMVTKTNKGGLEITVSNIRGFLPASQVDVHFVPDLEKYVGEKLTVRVTEANRAKRNLIVSRRAYLQEERDAQEQDLWKVLEVGQTKTGTVKTLKDYGAFIDIGGIDGFLHIGEISWTRLRHPSDVLAEGQQVEVQIVSLDPERKRIGLGMRQLRQNPWDTATQKYAQGTAVAGKVTRTTDFGAFIELEPGVEGLVHISELDYRRVNKVTDVLTVGQEAELQVLEVDLGRKRISLSLKALKEKPPEPEKKTDEDMAPSAGENYARKRKGPLKGGTSGSGGSGLFGNPGDFS